MSIAACSAGPHLPRPRHSPAVTGTVRRAQTNVRPGPATWHARVVATATTIADLIDLATSTSDSTDETITKVYEWQMERTTSTTKALVGAGFANLVAGGIALADQSSKVDQLVLWVIVSTSVVLLALGAWSGTRARALQREFLAAQFLLTELVAMRPFLRLLRFGRAS